ncbi:hypothetical protein LPC08_22505 [Roseomonas sp. OT10]|uniref:hypothetical protein n=1 Tax=Roseomonas cutis TaxID=2897332 RepID=UPI001E5DB549|nr:hypothetical protein [Roseomonas sp. OT10]UFN48745.1 hypothetical protein LPC08_22505 [Roseomonas sp. OT10]
MLRSLLGAGLLAATLAAAPAQAQRPGLYDVAGVSPGGEAYRGVLALRQVGLASWAVLWETEGGRFEGYGMSSGNTFAVGFTVANRPGVAIYTILPNGSMTGQWTLISSSEIGTETLTPRNEAPPAPRAAPAQPGGATGGQGAPRRP